MNKNEANEESVFRNRPGKNVWIGLIVLVLGFALLLDKMDFFFMPRWIFSWPMLLIGLGVVIGIKKGFSGIGWLIMVLIGSFFLLDDLTFFHWNLYEYGLPVGIIIIGLFLVFRSIIAPSRGSRYRGNEYTKYSTGERTKFTDEKSGSGEDEKKSTMSNGEDFIDVVAIFGSIKKKIFSKRFRGGETANFFGGTEIDLTQADIQGTVVLEIVQVFGGVKLIVPSNWSIKSDMVAILGGVADKRSTPPGNDSADGKTLVIDGVCIFGGIEIKSY